MVNWESYVGHGAEWNSHLERLGVDSFYQFHEWGEVKAAQGSQVIRLLGKRDGTVVSMFQGFVHRLPLGFSLIWVPGGMAGRETADLAGLENEIRKNGSGVKWGVIRFSFLKEFSDSDARDLERSRVRHSSMSLGAREGFVLDLKPETEELSKNFSSNWRHNANRGKKKNPRIEKWNGSDPQALKHLYQELEKIKKIDQQYSDRELELICEKFQSRIAGFVCRNESGEPIALRACVISGNKAWDLFAAANAEARKLYSSYLLCHELLLECKSRGVELYDFSGVDPTGNVGVYNFKKGTGARQIRYLGEWYASSLPGLGKSMDWALKWRSV